MRQMLLYCLEPSTSLTLVKDSAEYNESAQKAQSLGDVIASLKKTWRYPAKTLLLSLKIFTGISVSWVVFVGLIFINSSLYLPFQLK